MATNTNCVTLLYANPFWVLTVYKPEVAAAVYALLHSIPSPTFVSVSTVAPVHVYGS